MALHDFFALLAAFSIISARPRQRANRVCIRIGLCTLGLEVARESKVSFEELTRQGAGEVEADDDVIR